MSVALVLEDAAEPLRLRLVERPVLGHRAHVGNDGRLVAPLQLREKVPQHGDPLIRHLSRSDGYGGFCRVLLAWYKVVGEGVRWQEHYGDDYSDLFPLLSEGYLLHISTAHANLGAEATLFYIVVHHSDGTPGSVCSHHIHRAADGGGEGDVGRRDLENVYLLPRALILLPVQIHRGELVAVQQPHHPRRNFNLGPLRPVGKVRNHRPPLDDKGG
mmetsp:Transcript_4763/g.10999  ORF Transcript_4763/g.10999 Transcript_4763/m.10999 type:complete len:215 (-) Transcript_4763:205-849(-)